MTTTFSLINTTSKFSSAKSASFKRASSMSPLPPAQDELEEEINLSIIKNPPVWLKEFFRKNIFTKEKQWGNEEALNYCDLSKYLPLFSNDSVFHLNIVNPFNYDVFNTTPYGFIIDKAVAHDLEVALPQLQECFGDKGIINCLNKLTHYFASSIFLNTTNLSILYGANLVYNFFAPNNLLGFKINCSGKVTLGVYKQIKLSILNEIKREGKNPFLDVLNEHLSKISASKNISNCELSKIFTIQTEKTSVLYYELPWEAINQLCKLLPENKHIVPHISLEVAKNTVTNIQIYQFLKEKFLDPDINISQDNKAIPENLWPVQTPKFVLKLFPLHQALKRHLQDLNSKENKKNIKEPSPTSWYNLYTALEKVVGNKALSNFITTSGTKKHLLNFIRQKSEVFTCYNLKFEVIDNKLHARIYIEAEKIINLIPSQLIKALKSLNILTDENKIFLGDILCKVPPFTKNEQKDLTCHRSARIPNFFYALQLYENNNQWGAERILSTFFYKEDLGSNFFKENLYEVFNSCNPQFSFYLKQYEQLIKLIINLPDKNLSAVSIMNHFDLPTNIVNKLQEENNELVIYYNKAYLTRGDGEEIIRLHRVLKVFNLIYIWKSEIFPFKNSVTVNLPFYEFFNNLLSAFSNNFSSKKLLIFYPYGNAEDEKLENYLALRVIKNYLTEVNRKPIKDLNILYLPHCHGAVRIIDSTIATEALTTVNLPKLVSFLLQKSVTLEDFFTTNFLDRGLGVNYSKFENLPLDKQEDLKQIFSFTIDLAEQKLECKKWLTLANQYYLFKTYLINRTKVDLEKLIIPVIACTGVNSTLEESNVLSSIAEQALKLDDFFYSVFFEKKLCLVPTFWEKLSLRKQLSVEQDFMYYFDYTKSTKEDLSTDIKICLKTSHEYHKLFFNIKSLSVNWGEINLFREFNSIYDMGNQLQVPSFSMYEVFKSFSQEEQNTWENYFSKIINFEEKLNIGTQLVNEVIIKWLSVSAPYYVREFTSKYLDPNFLPINEKMGNKAEFFFTLPTHNGILFRYNLNNIQQSKLSPSPYIVRLPLISEGKSLSAISIVFDNTYFVDKVENLPMLQYSSYVENKKLYNTRDNLTFPPLPLGEGTLVYTVAYNKLQFVSMREELKPTENRQLTLSSSEVSNKLSIKPQIVANKPDSYWKIISSSMQNKFFASNLPMEGLDHALYVPLQYTKYINPGKSSVLPILPAPEKSDLVTNRASHNSTSLGNNLINSLISFFSRGEKQPVTNFEGSIVKTNFFCNDQNLVASKSNLEMINAEVAVDTIEDKKFKNELNNKKSPIQVTLKEARSAKVLSGFKPDTPSQLSFFSKIKTIFGSNSKKILKVNNNEKKLVLEQEVSPPTSVASKLQVVLPNSSQAKFKAQHRKIGGNIIGVSLFLSTSAVVVGLSIFSWRSTSYIKHRLYLVAAISALALSITALIIYAAFKSPPVAEKIDVSRG